MLRLSDIARAFKPSHRGGTLLRRDFLKLGALGLALPQVLALRALGKSSSPAGAKAKSCIVLFAWGGISHLDTWDLKPDASSDIRGEFRPIDTSAHGVQMSEHLPLLARQAHHLAIVRSVHHAAPSHRSAAYWNLTGHAPPLLDANWDASRNDWPCLGSLTAAALERRSGPRGQASALPCAFALPYHMADGGRANGQDGGFLGLAYDPILVRPIGGRLYAGISPSSGTIHLEPPPGVDAQRLAERRTLHANLESFGRLGPVAETAAIERANEQAFNMLLDPSVRDAFDLDKEPAALRASYGDHVCGQSTLLARRLSDAGVPLVTVYCAAGDLNGSAGSHFDTHGDNFNRLKRDMLPPLDQASAALLQDLQQRGRLEETLVVWLTEFGRTPKINGSAGRDHFPSCYSVAFAGGGVRGGQVYGRSNSIGSEPAEKACGPADLHATIFHALGIDPHLTLHDLTGRPHTLCDGRPLAIT
ncbi:MAG: DUF1501 domain-containing protein [Pedosphaera sp.]|nr:DUF1501 domain-containing protein [Pedosphaera sp.]